MQKFLPASKNFCVGACTFLFEKVCTNAIIMLVKAFVKTFFKNRKNICGTKVTNGSVKLFVAFSLYMTED